MKERQRGTQQIVSSAPGFWPVTLRSLLTSVQVFLLLKLTVDHRLQNVPALLAAHQKKKHQEKTSRKLNKKEKTQPMETASFDLRLLVDVYCGHILKLLGNKD